MENDAFKVFYSWASDFPPNTNKEFIHDALTQVCAERPSSSVEVCVDRDIARETGAPDIAETIFKKISTAHAIVADVSLISGGPRPAPNPNVMIELGYAVAQPQIGWNRVVLVFNEATGAVEDLPFDIRARSIKRYNLAQNASKQDRKIARGSLKAQLAGELNAMVETPRSPLIRGQPAPRLTAVWADREGDEIGTTLTVAPAMIPSAADWEQRLRSRLVSETEISTLQDEWTKLVAVISRLPKSVSKLEKVPAKDDAITIIRDFNRRVESRLLLAERDPDTRLFAMNVRERAVCLQLQIRNVGAAYAQGVKLKMRSSRRIRFGHGATPLVKEREPVLSHECQQLLRLAGQIPELEVYAKMSGVLKIMENIVRANEFGALAQVLSGSDISVASYDPFRVSEIDGSVVGSVDKVEHGFTRLIRSDDVVFVHALELGEEEPIEYELHAKELSVPSKGTLLVRAELPDP